MTVDVEVLLFPGLPNPRFALNRDGGTAFEERLNALPLASTLLERRAEWLSATGYHGMQLRIFNEREGSMSTLHVAGELVRGDGMTLVDQGHAFERWLFEQTPPVMRDQVEIPFAELIREGRPDMTIGGGDVGPLVACRDAPPFPEPNPKSIWEVYRLTNNCYNYALDLPAGNWALPGRTPRPFGYQPDELVGLVQQDGSAFLGETLRGNEMCPLSAHLFVVCLLDPWHERGNFHCFRLDREGGWSHKFGAKSVTNLDDREEPIRSLAEAHFAARMEVCGVFLYAPARGGSITLL